MKSRIFVSFHRSTKGHAQYGARWGVEASFQFVLTESAKLCGIDMLARIASFGFGALICGVVSAQSLEDRFRELERRGYAVWRIRGFAAIDQARNRLAYQALERGFEETFWIDSDIAFSTAGDT